MRLVLQRVAHASVTIDGKVVGKIDKGILALVGMNTGDDESVFERMFNLSLIHISEPTRP